MASFASSVGAIFQVHKTGDLKRYPFLSPFVVSPSHNLCRVPYKKCPIGALSNAQLLFDIIPSRDKEDSHSYLITSHVQGGNFLAAFELFRKMVDEGDELLSSVMTYASIVRACGSATEEKFGALVHGMLVKSGVGLEDEIMLWNTVITMYGKFGNTEAAKKVFELMSKKDVVSWNAVIAVHEQNGDATTVLVLFRRMLKAEAMVEPNRITFLSVIGAISAVSDLKVGRELHAQVIRLGLDRHCSVGNALISMYSKCSRVGDAEKIFEKQILEDVISWNSMLSGYERNKKPEDCLHLYSLLLRAEVRPQAHSFTIVLNAASGNPTNASFLKICRGIHGYILKINRHTEEYLSICNALITAYGKFNCVMDAEKIFDRLSIKDKFTWNAKMDAYSNNSLFEEALATFISMLEQGVHLDQSSFSIILAACGRSVSLEKGRQLHSIIAKLVNHRDLAQSNFLLSVCNSLLSMYSKCGEMEDATRAFNLMEKTDVFTWTGMITGYAYQGMGTRSLQLYEKMLNTGVKPNHVTFLGVLTACAHNGLIEDGVRLFNSMAQDHGLSPSFEHYACLVDLYSRSGQFECADGVIQCAISGLGTKEAGIADLYRVMLGACHAQNKLDLGISTASRILELEPNDEATHILLANLYAASGLWDDAIRVRKAIELQGLSKEVGCSWIEIGQTKHVFVPGDISHPRTKDIYSKLRELSFQAKKKAMSQ